MTLREQLRCLRDLLEVARGVPEKDRAVLVSLAYALAVEWDRAEKAEHVSAPEPASVSLHYVLTFHDGSEIVRFGTTRSLRRVLEEVEERAARAAIAKT